MTVELVTERVSLRQFTEAYRSDMVRFYGDSEVMNIRKYGARALSPLTRLSMFCWATGISMALACSWRMSRFPALLWANVGCDFSMKGWRSW